MLESTISDLSTEKTFRTVFDPIEGISVPMNYAWRTAKLLNSVSDVDAYRTAFQRVRCYYESYILMPCLINLPGCANLKITFYRCIHKLKDLRMRDGYACLSTMLSRYAHLYINIK